MTYCAQPIKVPFNAPVFAGTEITMRLPKMADAISRIRIVIPTNILEEIIQEAEIINVEKLYGEFIRIRNDLSVSIEKSSLRNGLSIIDLPFYCLRDLYFDVIDIRILFNGTGNELLDGHFLIDYVATDSIPKNPYFKKTRHVSVIKSPVTFSAKVILDVYIPGSVYELFFTVRDTTNNFITKNIKNIQLLVDDKERFNLPGEHLMYIEPLKSFGSFSSNVMMYSFSLDDEYGQTLLSTNQRFIIEFFNNSDSGVFTIWACSRNFVYNSKHVFETYEYVQAYSNQIKTVYPVPLKTSSVNFLNSMTVFTSSNVNINTPSVQIFKGDSNQTITYSSPGFFNVQCIYNYSININTSQQLFLEYILNPNIFIDGNNRLYSTPSTQTVYTDQYACVFILNSGVLSKYSSDLNTLLYTVLNVSALPSTYFGFEVIPLLGKNIRTSLGTIITSNQISCAVVDSSNIYATDGYNIYIYDTHTLQTKSHNSFGNASSTYGTIVLNSTGPVLSQSNYGVIQYDFSLNVVSHTTFQGTAYKSFIDNFNQVYVSFINSGSLTVYKLGTSQYYQLSGADTYDISFSGSLFILTVSAINSDILTSTNLRVPKGISAFILLDLNLQISNGTETLSYNYFNTPLLQYTTPKYDASYFSPIVKSIPFNYIYEYLSYAFMSSGLTGRGSGIALSGSNLYLTVTKTNVSSNIFTSQPNISNVYIPNSSGSTDVLVSFNSSTITPNWASYIDNTSISTCVTCDTSNVYMGFHSGFSFYSIVTSNVYNSDFSVFTTNIPYSVSMVKYNSNGYAQWMIYCLANSLAELTMNSISCDNSNSYVLFSSYGLRLNTITVYNSSHTLINTFYAGSPIIILKCDINGNVINTLYCSTGGGFATGVNIISQNSNIYVTIEKDQYARVIFSSFLFPTVYTGSHCTCLISTDNNFVPLFGIMISCDYHGLSSVDINGNIYMCGYSGDKTANIYDSTMNFNVPYITSPTIATSTKGPFIVKFSPSGVYQWKYFAGASLGAFIQCSSNGSYIFAIGNAPTGGTIGTVSLPSGCSFIVCLTLSGVYNWVSYISNSVSTYVTSDSSYVYVSGNYTGYSTIVDGSGTYYNTYNSSNQTINFCTKFLASNGYLYALPTIFTFTVIYTLGTGIVLSWTGTNFTTVSVALVSGPPITGFTSPQTYSGTSGIISSGFTNGSSYTFSITPVGGIPFSVQPTVNIWGTLTGFTAVYTPGTGIVLSWTGTNITTVSVALVSGPPITGFTSPQTYSGTSGIISSGFTNGSSYTFRITPVGGPTFVTQATVTPVWGILTGFTAVYTPGTGIVLSWTGTNITTVSVALVSGPPITGFTSPQTYSGTSGIISSGFTNGSSYTFSITPVGGTTFLTQSTVTPVWGTITGFTAVYTLGTGIVLSWTGTNFTTVSVALVSGPPITGFTSPQTYSGTSGIISSGFTNGSSYTFRITPVGGPVYGTSAVRVTSLEYPPVALSKGTSITTISGQSYGNGTYYYSVYNSRGVVFGHNPDDFSGQNVFDKLNDGTPYTYYESNTGYYLADTGVPDSIYAGQVTISDVTYTGAYIQISLPYPIILTSYSFSFVSTTTNTPYNWVLGGTNDNNLILIDQQNAQTPTPGTTVTYTTNSIVPYNSFCVSLTCAKPNPGASGYTVIDIGEWRLFGF
jgi:hypothetical protein